MKTVKQGGVKKIVIILLSLIMIVCCGACAVQTDNQSKEENKSETETYYDKLLSCVDQIRKVTDFEPDIVLALGRGMGAFADNIETVAEIAFEDIDGFPIATSPEHEGKLIFGTFADKKLAVMKGHLHYYEGYTMDEVVLPLRVLHLLGADTVIFTNSVGSINLDYKPGEFMAVSDHISSFVPSPLVGENIDELGERFVDQTNVYDKDLIRLLQDIGKENKIVVHTGVYVQTPGPQYETPAEVKMFRICGADTVGSSTAVEAIAAKHMGMRICALNSITNFGAGMQSEISQDGIEGTEKKLFDDFTVLISELLKRMQE